MVEYATSTSTRGICFSPASSWDDAVVVTTSDVSFCQEQEQLDGITQKLKSQQACIATLASGSALNAQKLLIHPLSWSSTRIKRACRSTLMAEAYALSNAVEHGLRTTAAIVDGSIFVNGRKRLLQQWGLVQFTDCESLLAQSISPNTKQIDNKRLAIDLSALKQLIWKNLGDCVEEVGGSKGHYPRWIDTSAMLSGFAKTMTPLKKEQERLQDSDT